MASRVEQACEQLAELVATQAGGDENYYRNNAHRFAATARRIDELAPRPVRLLDIGSHYLHQASLMRFLGHEVHGIDVGLFADAEFVRERAAKVGIANEAIGALANGDFGPGLEDSFEIVVFTEILEHITFNPIRMWQRIYDLLQPGGFVYVTTPNGVRPTAVARAAWRAVTFRVVGVELDEIFNEVTYGHHWKEYSAPELRQYFARLSPDFDVSMRYVTKPALGSGAKRLARQAAYALPLARPDLEAVVRLPRKTRFTATEPRLPMSTK